MKLLSVVILSLCLQLLAGCIVEDDMARAWSLRPGDKVPDFSVVLSDGRRWNSADMHGRIYVVVFFNTGCKDCRRELPKLQEAYMAADGVNFICIAREESEKDISTFWREYSLTMPFAPQDDRAVYSLFAEAGIPRIYVVDQESVISATFSETDVISKDSILEAIKLAGVSL